VLLPLIGCATEPGRVAGPGAMVAGVGGRLVNAHDAVARAILGDAAKPMLIAPPDSGAMSQNKHTDAVRAASLAGYRQAASADAHWSSPAEATSCDLDGDGTVSLDEIVALGRSGITDEELLQRLERTRRTFELSASQEQYLRVRGISDGVIVRLGTRNRAPAPSALPGTDIATVPAPSDMISHPDSGAAAR